MSQEIDESVFNDWKRNPVTKQLLANLERLEADVRTQATPIRSYEMEHFDKYHAHCMGMLNVIGRIQMLELEDFKPLEEDIDDSTQVS